jgi:hypothetical protein
MKKWQKIQIKLQTDVNLKCDLCKLYKFLEITTIDNMQFGVK